MKKNLRVIKVVTEMKLRRRYFGRWLKNFLHNVKRKEKVFKAMNFWGNQT